MTKLHNIPWLRIGAESVAIVASILLAFAIDAWWEGIKDRRLETEYLERLLEDQQANIAMVESLNLQQARQLANARRSYPLVSHGDWDGLDTNSAVISSYLASPTPSPTWVDDTFEELKSTGNLNLLRSASLRTALLEFYRYLEGADYAYELMSTAYRDAVRARMDPDVQLAIRDCMFRAVECSVDVASPGFADYVDWLDTNPELADGLRRVIVQVTRAEEEYLPGVLERIASMIKLIEDNMGW